MSQTDLVLLNDQLVPRREAKVDIEDRGYQFGDGIYEVVRFYNGQTFLMEEHLERLERSAREIRLQLPLSIDKLHKRLDQLVKQSACTDGIIYLQVTRGVAPRNHPFPSPEVKAQLVAYTKPYQRPFPQLEQGVKGKLIEDIRWLRCDIKSINLLPNILAKQQAVENGAYEAILHRDGKVTEGSSSNVFIVKEGILYTHPANHLILNGITRQFVLKLCADLNLSVIEHVFDVNELLQADEVFITATTTEIMPIIQVDDQKIGQGLPGPITRKLIQAYEERISHLAPQKEKA